MNQFNGFDDWGINGSDGWGDYTSTSDSWLSEGLNSVLGTAKEIAGIKAMWEGDISPSQTMPYSLPNQQTMLYTPEQAQNMGVNGLGEANKPWYQNPAYLVGAIAAAGLLYVAVAK